MVANDDFWENWIKTGENKQKPNHSSLDGAKCEEHFKSLFSKIDKDIDKVLKKVAHPTNVF